MATLTLTWTDTSGTTGGNATDILHGAIINSTKNESMSIPPLVTRSVETQVITLKTGWAKTDDLHLYGAWRTADGLETSDTMYALITEA
jgi:hypothetical protein